MQNLDEKYILLLKKMLIFPTSNKIYLSFIEFILEKKKLKSKLNFLVRRGWLLYDKDGYIFLKSGKTIPVGEGVLTTVSFTDFGGVGICFASDANSLTCQDWGNPSIISDAYADICPGEVT